MSVRDSLHDRIDAREALADEARTTAQQIIKGRFAEALEKTTTIEGALKLLALWVAQALDPVTTKAVRTGARLIRKRRGK